ncbi:MAG: threonylcarbamoyl-AMP synthase [Elusimicrobia bacterium CG_4_10_14_0_2_um_filter_56_8]|nr:MAG: threonylcarbamoyl-AMP synthase [Elusimicrobia bacterium CG1_02_56_21]PJA17848.1 MAG: threonylcarbamoyl-AMP synthase [Elusimicrobia bacterium CG_4_10_14_0_2_um_filter_56_8]
MRTVKASTASLKKAAALIRAGGIVAFPTETVYGLGADGLNPQACARIFEIKGRPRFDPLILHECTAARAKKLFSKIPAGAEKLMKKFWPGPLTLVLPKSRSVPEIVTSGLPTVAVRVPANAHALALIKAAGRPIAAPSANRFGRLSPTTAAHVKKQLGDGPDLILDGGATHIGVESTIITFTRGKPVLLRPGGLPLEEIEKIAGPACKPEKTGKKRPLAPGCLKKHYSPEARLVIIEPGVAIKPAAKAAYLAFSRKPAGTWAGVQVLSRGGDLREAAANLFSALHKLENSRARVIYAERVPAKGLGRAIMDRLRRASAV